MNFYLNRKPITLRELCKSQAHWAVDWMIREAQRLHRWIDNSKSYDEYRFQLWTKKERLNNNVLLIEFM